LSGATSTTNPNRMESAADHSFSCVLLARLLKEEIIRDFEGIDFDKLTDMLVSHDLVEIYAGDISIWDEEARKNKEADEIKAAEKIFGMIPGEKGPYFHGLWKEFEEGKTTEARVSRMIDLLDPMVQNIHSRGKVWKDKRITMENIKKKKELAFKNGGILSQLFQEMMKEIKEKNLTGERSS